MPTGDVEMWERAYRGGVTRHDFHSNIKMIWVYDDVVITGLRYCISENHFRRDVGANNGTHFAKEPSPRRSNAVLIASVCIGVYEPTEVVVKRLLSRSTARSQRFLRLAIDKECDRLRAVICDDVFPCGMHEDERGR